jgi:hypothetical protein
MEPLMAMEIRRQSLLREMGISCWFPRNQLPGAGASHCLVVVAPEPELSPTANSAKTPTPAVEEQIPAALRAALAPEATVSAVASPAAAVTDPAPSADDEPVPAFAFSWFSVGQGLSVLAMLPPDVDRLTGGCRQMLSRILAALSPTLKDGLGQEHTFHWPFPGDLGLPTGRRAARQAVDGFVARRQREQPASMLLILADDRPPFLYDDSAADKDEPHQQMPKHRQFEFAMLRTNSLHAMEADSALKRSAWQAMQSLRDRL